MGKEATVKTFDIGDGRTISIETGKLASLADGSVVVRCGNAMLLATVVSAKEPKPDVDFFPLTVDYQEKFASAGRIPGGFLKRESRLSDYEILISRLVDRALRPLFDDYHNETQVLITLISADKEVLPDAMACLAASAAIMVSDIPFNNPVAEVRIGRINGEFKVNPGRTELKTADLDIIVAATERDIVMVEGEMKEVSEQDLVAAIKVAHEAIKIQCRAQKELVEMLTNKKDKRERVAVASNDDMKKKVESIRGAIHETAKSGLSKAERKDAFKKIKDDFMTSLAEATDEEKSFAKKYISSLEKDVMRQMVLNDKMRLDGRKLDEVRPIWIEVDYLPSAHGSALFTRGETQSLTTVTLGTKMDEQMIDSAMVQDYLKFILHYNFPPFSTGEIKPQRGPARREVGHGNLAMRSLKQVLPPLEQNPYTVRIVSDILESNGSSSMATVCAGSLALMDAGIKITGPISGIAMGLISEGDKYAVLSDILGDEDHLGDMDFKVTGTAKGICGCQMDIKVDGLRYEVLEEALAQAKAGRLHILAEMNKALAAPKEDYKPHAPRIVKLSIPKEFIGAVIGPGGKIIQEMQRETNTVITIEEVDNRGEISISSENKDSIDRAVAKIKGITTVPEVGEVYDATVKSLMPYGAFVEFLPGKEGLLHISEVSHKRLDSLEGVIAAGDKIKVKLVEVDPKSGKFRLSRKVLMPKPESEPANNNS